MNDRTGGVEQIHPARLFLAPSSRAAASPSISAALRRQRRSRVACQWRSREFVVRDCDGRLLAFGAPWP